MNIDGINTLACIYGMDDIKGDVQSLPAAAHACGQGSDPRPHAFLRPARIDHAVVGNQNQPPCQRVETVDRGPRQTGRPL
ncbi:SdhB [Caligus rogercresseyi]|uniref:SdhB n=1 Tax=Caligus rogercresseyi TaxID=217165 RepID=A0A7T8K0B8_CALRO|nr:SdhB [Caligus rogercresseyi]